MHNPHILNISVRGKVRGGSMNGHCRCSPRIEFAGDFLRIGSKISQVFPINEKETRRFHILFVK